MTDTTDPQTAEPLRIPIGRNVTYAVRGMPAVANAYGPGFLVPTEISLTYRAVEDSQLGRFHAYVKGQWLRDGEVVPSGEKLPGQHYYGDPSTWPEWLAEEARLHDPDAVLSVLPPAADRGASYRHAADAIESMQGYPHLILPEEIVAGLRLLAAGEQPDPGSPAYIRRLAAGERDEQPGTTAFSPGEGVHGRDPYYAGSDTEAQQQAETQAEEVALLRLTVGAVEEGRRELRSENARLRAQLWTLAAALDGLHTLIATSSRDWGTYRVDAWLWAVLVGWDCEEAHEHGELCEDGAAMAEMQERHGWSDEAVAKARRYRGAVHVLTAPAAAPVAGQPPADTGEARPRFVRVCIACPQCDHTLDENGACANGCHAKGRPS